MSRLADRRWRLIRDDPRDGPHQMALEEVAARTALERDVRTVRVYSWEPSTLSLGYHQSADSVDWAYCDREGIAVTRRQTGGGGIYHDRVADLSYTIVAPASEVPGDLMDCYELFCEPILDAFARMGVDADFAASEQAAIHPPSCYLREINPAHDVVAPANGDEQRKISGNAQYRQRDVVIQHGSLRYDLEPDRHLGVFDGHGRSIATFTDRVTSIREEAGIDRRDAVSHLADALGEWCDAEDGAWTADELDAAGELADRKYGTDSWVRNREVHDAGAA